MRIWIDLANSPHVPFFRALIPEFAARGHQVEITARDFAQTVELAVNAGMTRRVIGGLDRCTVICYDEELKEAYRAFAAMVGRRGLFFALAIAISSMG